jgi:hypothetical protein
VLSIAGEGRHSLSQATQNGEPQIQKRKARKHDGQQDPGAGTIGGSTKVQSQEGRSKTQRCTSAIAHEDFSRGKIEKKKAQATAQQNPGQDAPKVAIRDAPGHEKVANRNQRRYTSGHTIGPVEEIESVHGGYQEETRSYYVQSRRMEQWYPPSSGAEQQRRSRLHEKPRGRVQSPNVLDQADYPDP